MSQRINIRPFQKSDSDKVKEFISDIIVNEFKFKLIWLDSDILAIDRTRNKSNRVAFGLQKSMLMTTPMLNKNNNKRIVGTIAIPNWDTLNLHVN